MVICIGVGLTLLGPWLPYLGFGPFFGFFLLCPGCGLVVSICCLPRAVGFLLGGFCWLCPYVGVGFCLSGVFVFGLMPLFLCFRGDAVHFSSFLGAFFGFWCILCWALPFWK